MEEINEEHIIKNVGDVGIIAAAFDEYWSPSDVKEKGRILSSSDGRTIWIQLLSEKNNYIRVLDNQKPGIGTHFLIQREIDDWARIKYSITEIREEIPRTGRYKRAAITFQQISNDSTKINFHAWMPPNDPWGPKSPLLSLDIFYYVFFYQFIEHLKKSLSDQAGNEIQSGSEPNIELPTEMKTQAKIDEIIRKYWRSLSGGEITSIIRQNADSGISDSFVYKRAN